MTTKARGDIAQMLQDAGFFVAATGIRGGKPVRRATSYIATTRPVPCIGADLKDRRVQRAVELLHEMPSA